MISKTMRLRTPLCELFGIEVPIFAAGMAGVTLAPLAAAVSAAGGLGTLGATGHTPDALREEIRAVRQITDRPFGVGLMFPTDIPMSVAERNVPPLPSFLERYLPEIAGLEAAPRPPPLTQELAEAQVAVALEERVPVIACGLGTPEWLVERAHRVGTKIISLIGRTKQARALEAMGVDCIVAQGVEAGGHTGSISTLVLVPQVVREVAIPVLAAGGIVDGAGIAAGLACGAQGAWIGTRFLVTRESSAHPNHKSRIMEIDEGGTAISRCYTGKPSRILRNKVIDAWKEHEAEIMPMPWQAIRIAGLVEAARAAGRVDLANFPAGQGSGAITDMPSAAEVLERLVAETVEAIRRTSACATAS